MAVKNIALSSHLAAGSRAHVLAQQKIIRGKLKARNNHRLKTLDHHAEATPLECPLPSHAWNASHTS